MQINFLINIGLLFQITVNCYDLPDFSKFLSLDSINTDYKYHH